MQPSVIEDEGQVIFAAKQILNSLRSRRVIGRPESVHLALGLPLTVCSESLVAVRISGWARLQHGSKWSGNEKAQDILTKYHTRSSHFNLSLWQYFHVIYNRNDDKEKNKGDKFYIPFATGLNCDPVFPVSISYAKGTLIKHLPWSKQYPLKLSSDDVILDQFNDLIQSEGCPLFLKTEYKRVETEFKSKTYHVEPTNMSIKGNDEESVYINGDKDGETENLLRVMNSFTRTLKNELHYRGHSFDIGLKYNWSNRKDDNDKLLEGRTWLMKQIDEYGNKNNNTENVIIPKQWNGSKYLLNELSIEQSEIVFQVLYKIVEWLEFPTRHKINMSTTFEPLRMTVVGAAGTGKSYLINTLISSVRTLTGIHDSVIVTGPTGKN